MKTKTFLLGSLILSTVLYSQVGINTVNPQGVFNIDSAKDNPTTGIPSATQQANDVVVTAAGNMGIGITAPTNKLHIIGANPLRLQGVTTGNINVDQLLAVDSNGVVKNIGTLNFLSIPTPAIFRLNSGITDFLSTEGAGGSQVVPMTLVKNSIPNLTYDAASSTINFPSGTYQMTFVYEGVHVAPGCTISSYFIDFPLNLTGTRIHSTASHVEGGVSSHGGSITYATTVPAGTGWQIHLGRGQSGNCSGPGMILAGESTQLLIFRIGD
ncbi:hypothetical protein [Chryseobacterium sp. OSA05B]|uniref:hypothetical protein n=1 Tax=Chryseobacterium sp. OSA05B TaxID=2862650 RepID=UPI001CBB6E66|nr:hypothetical protein [Chryseobacterium sp. OSA05B]